MGYSASQIYQMLHSGQGSEGLYATQDAANSQAMMQDQINQKVAALNSKMSASWTGSASEGAQTGAGPMVKAASDASTTLGTTQDLVGRQADSFQVAKASVVDVPENPPQYTGMDAVTHFLGISNGTDTKIAQYNNNSAQNVAAYDEYNSASTFNADNMPTSYGAIKAENATISVVDPTSVGGGSGYTGSVGSGSISGPTGGGASYRGSYGSGNPGGLSLSGPTGGSSYNGSTGSGNPGGTWTAPGGTTQISSGPGGGYSGPGGGSGWTSPGGGNGGLPEGYTLGPNGEVIGPNGQIIGPNGQVLGPGESIGPNGEILGPNGQVLGPNGQVLGPNGQPLGPGQSIGPNGEILGPNGEILSPGSGAGGLGSGGFGAGGAGGGAGGSGQGGANGLRGGSGGLGGPGGTGGAEAANGAAGRGGIGMTPEESAMGGGVGGAPGEEGSPGGMGGGRGGRREEDREHQTASYLQEADPDALFGTDQLTSPPVIGE